MKRWTVPALALVLSFVLAGPAFCGGVDAEVRGLVDELAKAYAAKDLDRVMSYMAEDATLLVMRPGAQDQELGRDAIQVLAAADMVMPGKVWAYYRLFSVRGQGDVARVEGQATLYSRLGGDTYATPEVRFSATASKRAGRWVMVRTRVTLPSEDQPEGQAGAARP